MYRDYAQSHYFLQFEHLNRIPTTMIAACSSANHGNHYSMLFVDRCFMSIYQTIVSHLIGATYSKYILHHDQLYFYTSVHELTLHLAAAYWCRAQIESSC